MLFAARNNQTKLTGARGHCEESLHSQELAERKMFVQVYAGPVLGKGLVKYNWWDGIAAVFCKKQPD